MKTELPINFGEWSVDYDIYAGWHYWHDDHDGSPECNPELRGGGNSLSDCLELILQTEYRWGFDHASGLAKE